MKYVVCNCNKFNPKSSSLCKSKTHIVYSRVSIAAVVCKPHLATLQQVTRGKSAFNKLGETDGKL